MLEIGTGTGYNARTSYHNGALLRLFVYNDGITISTFIGSAAFMRLREQRTPFGYAARLGDLVDGSPTAAPSMTNIPPIEMATGDGAFSVGLQLPDVQCGVFFAEPQWGCSP